VNAYAGWGAYGASKAGLLHLTRIWDEELRPLGVRAIAFDPGDMDTPLHAAAVPDADRSALRAPAESAAELIALLEAHVAANVSAGAALAGAGA
jgi:NAD(P)-dependent dehydrogenase (short-subunit alcohol dehydrogenase family)